MERCHSNSSLPQGFSETAKYNLVKIPCSKSEIKIFVSEDCLAMGDQNFKTKRRKPNPMWKSIQDLCLKTDIVAPSTESDANRKCSQVSSQDDLWTSILPDYTFLMADDLITECKETREELCLPLSQFSSSKSKEPPDTHQILSYNEFLDHFNKLHDTIHSLQTSADQLSETKYKDLLSECQYLKEQASVLKLMNPELTETVNLRSAVLKNKLQLLEQRLFPKKEHEKDIVIKSLKSQMKEIRKWLQEMEGKLRKLKISDNCDTEEIDEVFSQEKILQREIEGRGKELTTIVRQCNTLEGATVAESKKLRRAAAHLERSWHNIWIRSLEKQCLTEQRLLERQTYENNHRESSDPELDEGPLNKHRRLSLDRWTAVATTPSMDRTRRDRGTLKSNDVIKNGVTKDVGILCSDLIPVNDKCIMVGTTGIAALKAEYGDDFTNFEIIQDVGYSSESSTHLSSDDGFGIGSDRYYNIRVYNYSNKTPTKCTSLKEELEDADSRQPQSLSSSLGSSSGATSFNDSGIGASDLLSANSSARDKLVDLSEVPVGDKAPFEGLSRELCENFARDVFGEESDFLETVLESCANFCVSDGEKGAKGDSNDLQYVLSGLESDDSSDNFHNRSSFTTSSQLFYKMISVESENDEGETRINENICPSVKTVVESHPSNELETSLDSSHLSKTLIELTPPKESSHQDTNSNIEQNIPKPTFDFDAKPFQKSPSKEPNDRRSPAKNATPNLKRKRDSEPADFAPATWQGGGKTPHRVRSWLKRTSHHTEESQLSGVRRCLFRSSSDQSSCEDTVPNLKPFNEDISSCDASGEYTSSSADEGNAHSSSSYDDDERRLRLEGSVETVLRGLGGSPRRCSDVDWLELSPMLLPPPLSSTPACLRKGQCKVGKSHHPLSGGSHCGDMKWLVLKASSEGDLRSRRGHLSESNHSLANIPTDIRHKKGTYDSSSLEYKHRMCSSLPNVLRHRSDSSTEDMKTSQSESKSSRRCNGHDESFTSVVSHNQSSSSDLERRKRRRNRRKSSSSNRSSRSVLTSCDTNRSRTRTLTGSIIGSRRRHFSQKSDFFEDSENDIEPGCEGPLLEETKCPIEEINHKTLKDELQLALAENCRSSASLLSPTESDVVLTHLEEQSTVSDQVWDNYQDMPYLSEAYSEATVDEDAVRKLTEFGDDYGSAIGQPLRYLDNVDSGKIKADKEKSPSKKSSKAFLTLVQSIDSDSDIEGLHHVIEDSEKALQFARATLKRRQSGDFFSSTENAELLATCGTYLHWLQSIIIEIDGNESNFSSDDLKELNDLIKEWKELKRSIEMYEDVDDTISQKYDKARKSIDVLYKNISEMSVITEMDVKDCVSWEHLQESISKLQMVMGTLQDTREILLEVNLQVHRFITQYGNNQEYKESSLKEDITELYQKWEDVYEKNGAQLTKMETLSNRWKQYQDKLRIFKSKVEEIQCISSNEDEPCDKNNTSCEELLKTLQNNLKELKRNADLIRNSSSGAPLWKSVHLELKDLEQRIKRETRTLSVSRNTIYQTSSADEDDPDDDFEDAIQKLEKDDSDKTFSSPKSPKHDSNLAKKSSSRFWRIIRVAVPVQLTLVLLFCLACYLEPNCCDRMNNFNFSFTPHLRYFGGPPPV